MLYHSVQASHRIASKNERMHSFISGDRQPNAERVKLYSRAAQWQSSKNDDLIEIEVHTYSHSYRMHTRVVHHSKSSVYSNAAELSQMTSFLPLFPNGSLRRERSKYDEREAREVADAKKNDSR